MNVELKFIFIGPQRTGTSWLYEHLRSHPSLCFPKGVKETRFFDRHYDKGIDWYKWHWQTCGAGQQCGEVAASYFHHPEVPGRIQAHFPACKIIVSLRDPVERAQSLYRHHYQKGRVRGTFSEAIKQCPDILSSGYYAEHMERWLAHFGEEHILVVSLNEIRQVPAQVLQKIAVFLQVPEQPLVDDITKEKVNTAREPRSGALAAMSSTVVNKLHARRLHWVVNAARKLGVPKLVYNDKSVTPGLSLVEERFLQKEYAPHIQYVNRKFGKSML